MWEDYFLGCKRCFNYHSPVKQNCFQQILVCLNKYIFIIFTVCGKLGTLLTSDHSISFIFLRTISFSSQKQILLKYGLSRATSCNKIRFSEINSDWQTFSSSDGVVVNSSLMSLPLIVENWRLNYNLKLFLFFGHCKAFILQQNLLFFANCEEIGVAACWEYKLFFLS